MYLKVESVSAVQIYPRSSTLAALNKRRPTTGTGGSPVRPSRSSTSQDAKIPVPLRHQLGGGAAAAAASAAVADSRPACTPDEIFCYTQFNSSRTPDYSHHFYPYASAATAGQVPHYLNQQSAMYPDMYNAFESPVDVFHGPGRPDRLEQVMSLHPQYFKIFTKSYETIMKGDGPLPFHYRHYIAIMAAGRHQCSYLIEQQVSEYRQSGGDPAWLRGLEHIPAKLRDLYEMNKVLAHRPWLVTKDHIEKLTKGSDSWSLGELCHALVILSHYHALSSFVFGVGIGDGEQEPPSIADTRGASSASSSSSPSSPSASAASSSTASAGALLDKSTVDQVPVTSSCPRPLVPCGNGSKAGSRVQSGRTSPDGPRSRSNSNPVAGSGRRNYTMAGGEAAESGLDALMRRMKSLAESRQEFSAEEQTKRYENMESESAELAVVPNESAATRPKAEISQFIDDPEFVYQDFARRGEPSLISTFRVQDYSWDDHAFSLLNRLYNDVGNLLDEKFRLMYALTYNFMGSKRDVDTSRFRTAIWNYIQCMFGIRHDDYDYGEVNQVLERSLKAYIKMVVCYPERVTRADYDSVLKEFHHSEKIHVNLMLLEARIQAELLYALRAVMRYMT